MKILIIGASGFLGRHLRAKFTALGHDVHALGSREIRRYLTRDHALAHLDHPHYNGAASHLAAWTQAGRLCLKHGGEQWVINNRINTNVLDWWHTQPQAKLIALGTTCHMPPRRIWSKTPICWASRPKNSTPMRSANACFMQG